MNINQINNVEDLISQAKEISSIDERAQFIMDYFFQTVNYNYAYLFAKGYVPVGIEGIKLDYSLTYNNTRIEGDEEFSIKSVVVQGESRMFNEITQMSKDFSGNYEQFITSLRSYISDELSKHIDNEDLVNSNTDVVIENIEKDLRKKKTIILDGDIPIEVNYDISKILIDYIMELSPDFPDENKHFKQEFENGLITNGVCENYTDYLVPLFNSVGIEAHDIVGTSELDHAWIIVKGEQGYKSIDLTRAVFIRDGFRGIPKNQTSQNWLYCDVSDIFKMQATRTITEIDGIKLQNAITPKNFDEQKFADLVTSINKGEISSNTFKEILKQSLQDGLTTSDCTQAEEYEQKKNHQKEGEVVKNEH